MVFGLWIIFCYLLLFKMCLFVKLNKNVHLMYFFLSIWRIMELEFCNNGSYLSDPWVNNGLTRCFNDTIISSILLSLMVLAGFAQISMYKKFATRVDSQYIKKSSMYNLQILLTLALIVEAIVRIFLEAYKIDYMKLYGYEILTFVSSIVVWSLSLVLILFERHYQLPAVPPKGHGLVLLMFWTLAFTAQNLAFISWFSPEWWWRERK